MKFSYLLLALVLFSCAYSANINPVINCAKFKKENGIRMDLVTDYWPEVSPECEIFKL